MSRARVREGAARALLLAALAAGGLCPALPAAAASIALQIELDGTLLGGISFQANDVALYDPVTGSAAMLLPATAFDKPTRVEALQVLGDGTLVLASGQSKRTLGGLTLSTGDIARYDPATDTASLLLAESVFDDGKAQVDAVQRLDDGSLAFSVAHGESIGGVGFGQGDIVRYDPATGSVSLLFSASLFGQGNVDVSGAFVSADGGIFLSTKQDATLGGLSFQAGDVVRYDPATGGAALVTDGALLPANTRMVAVYVQAPEPSAVLLLLSGIAGLLLFPRLSRDRDRARDGGR